MLVYNSNVYITNKKEISLFVYNSIINIYNKKDIFILRAILIQVLSHPSKSNKSLQSVHTYINLHWNK